jgi:hypothetical protein
VDFPERRTPDSTLTNGVSTYDIILSIYFGLRIIVITSQKNITANLCKNQEFCGYNQKNFTFFKLGA